MSTATGQKMKWKKGLTIAEVTGTVTKLFPSKSTPSKFKEGEMMVNQGGELELEGGGKIAFNSTNRPLDMSYRGKVITIESCPDSKDNLSGIKYNTYTGQAGEGEELKIGFYAKYTHEGKEVKENQDHGHSSSKSGGSSTTHTEYSEIPPDKLVGLITASHFDVDAIVREVYGKSNLDEETLRSYVATVFITAERRGVIDRCIQLGTEGSRPKPDRTIDRSVDQTPQDDDLPFTPDATGDEDFPDATPAAQEETFDYAEFTLPKSTKVPADFRGKKFAELFPMKGGKAFLQNLCLAFNVTDFPTDLSKALRQFCKDMKLVTVTTDGKAEAIF